MAKPLDVLAVAVGRLEDARRALWAASSVPASAAAQYQHQIAAYQMHEAQTDLDAVLTVAEAITPSPVAFSRGTLALLGILLAVGLALWGCAVALLLRMLG